MSMTRREFIKTSAIAATAGAAGVTIPGVNEALAQAGSATADGVRWASRAMRFTISTGETVTLEVKLDPAESPNQAD